MNIRLANPFTIHGWGNARGAVIEALDLIKSKFHEGNVNWNYTIGQHGIPLVPSSNIRNSAGQQGRGGWNGHRIALHTGYFPQGKVNPFSSLDAMARILGHEIMHSYGWAHHDSDGIMQAGANAWFDTKELAYVRARYGSRPKPKTKAQRLKEVNREIRRLQAGVDALMKRVQPSRRKIKELKEERGEIRKQLNK